MVHVEAGRLEDEDEQEAKSETDECVCMNG